MKPLPLERKNLCVSNDLAAAAHLQISVNVHNNACHLQRGVVASCNLHQHLCNGPCAINVKGGVLLRLHNQRERYMAMKHKQRGTSNISRAHPALQTLLIRQSLHKTNFDFGGIDC